MNLQILENFIECAETMGMEIMVMDSSVGDGTIVLTPLNKVYARLISALQNNPNQPDAAEAGAVE